MQRLLINTVVTFTLRRAASMQPSITKFFKSTKPPSEETSAPDGGDKLDKLDKLDEGEKVSTKRPADDEADSAADIKRQAVASPSSTPIKSETNKASKEEKTEVSSTTSSTPFKQAIMSQDKKDPPMSPLMNVNVMIRKKISSGAYALHENIGVSWFKALQGEFDKPYFKNLSEFVQQERKIKIVYPPENKVYSWTHHHDIKDTRVIILGQDPYHGPGQAHGLSFSVQKGVRIPPSLINIFKELENDITGFRSPPSGDLTGWAKQGVLMLNTCLTVTQGQPNSHQNKGWETFTDAVMTWFSKNTKRNIVFLLWGRPAQRKSGMIDKRHKVLTAAHPSPLSAHNGFFGCGHFSKANSFLRSQDLPEIDWKAL